MCIRFLQSVWLAAPPKEHVLKRIGFVSGDFRNHVVAYFLDFLKELKAYALEMVAFSTNFKEDARTIELKQIFDEFDYIADLDDESAVDLIRQKEIDILVDLSSLSGDNRLGIFALRAAPVQCSWLGWIGTTGIPNMDYVIADSVLCPPHLQGQFFPEKVWSLPRAYSSFTPSKKTIASHEAPFLKNGLITFGIFQDCRKATPESFNLWTRVLLLNPSAHLVWGRHNFKEEALKNHVLGEFEKLGADLNRITLLAVSGEEYWQCLQQVDVVLDSFPISGGTTTLEALWVGVPTITLVANQAASRLSASYLKTLGLNDFITTSIEDFLTLTMRITLGLSPVDLVWLRQNLPCLMRESVLCQPVQFAADFQEMLQSMWSIYLQKIKKIRH